MTTDNGEGRDDDYPVVARARRITDAVLTAASYRDAYLAVEAILDPSLNPTASPTPPLPAGSEQGQRAIADIAAERKRQVEAEGWTVAHDDEHDHNELAHAAGCYALADVIKQGEVDGPGTYIIPEYWPWDGEWWKPSPDRRRNLVKAGALIAAEIDRLDRASLQHKEAGRG